MAKKDTIDKLIKKINAFEKAYKSAIDSRTKKLGITPSQFKVLKALSEQGEMKHKDLTDITLITKGTLTGVVNRLEGAGLVVRKRDKKDSRAQIVSLTEKGVARYEKLNQDYKKIVSGIFSSETEDRLKTHINNLNALQAIVEANSL
ncbi:MarR family transcriptional regulator [Desulfurispirillum indicum]|uniref:Regulatory protein MarR n=1 Tax=Desulfurispirillum indicum (strain ATCC BAA-1389 / DSM 22839 / S5) TaxID=653733 RepID=E6W3K6_DESIS|nr:MarR family transcriptional regulator [Desulfurispirillum indicum]ADU65799.1 regulatory protein MarR [Desulfurispirillum indicum S5]UCZ57735.1 MarR family transcriptional regulator [Desulfurispirillum indicum]